MHTICPSIRPSRKLKKLSLGSNVIIVLAMSALITIYTTMIIYSE